MIALICACLISVQGVEPPLLQTSEQDPVTIEMTLRPHDRAIVGYSPTFEERGTAFPEVIAPAGSSSQASLRSGHLLEAYAMADPPHAYRVTIDSDADGDLTNEEPHILEPDDSVRIILRKVLYGEERSLPFELRYSRGQAPDGSRYESMSVFPLYHLEGQWSAGGQNTLTKLHDYTADGAFDWRDLGQGTAFGLDRNGDRKVEEWHGLGKVFAFQGRHWVVDRRSLSGLGPEITLYPSLTKVARLGEIVPSHTYRTVDGKFHQLGEFEGKLHIVNFWRTTCIPCIAKLPDFRALEKKAGEELVVTYYSTDDLKRRRRAFEIAREHDLPDAQLVVQGLGEDDLLWQSLGSMIGMGVPVYILIDTNGRVAHVSRTLAEVQAAMEKLTR